MRVVELAGIGPGAFGATVLSDLGADVIRIDRLTPVAEDTVTMTGPLSRGRRSIALDLKTAEGTRTALALIDDADVLIDPFRPGVTRRLGLGPEIRESRPRLIYAQMTGWGQDGPLAPRAGHDLNYLALSGALAMMGTPGEPPPVPLNLVADFGGGGMLLVMGITAALYERERSGTGQLLDVAMLDGVTMLAASLFQLRRDGIITGERGRSFLDGGAPWYRAYRTADARYVTVAALEPQFYRALLAALDIPPADHPQWDRSTWPKLTGLLEERFAAEPLSHWDQQLTDLDVCYAPVLDLDELETHPHHMARQTVSSTYGLREPTPAPRFSRTPARIQGPATEPGQHTTEILAELADRQAHVDLDH
ncbi:CaiB/BaiF CoA transferase family protein [Pseudonocardia endophytica]|uniref:CaiB/BaiF CoA transferase family protein n=1 Tax=Pseudonocardia endophytica TaxID=401976 RepID=UPI001FB4BC6C|nr:CaiB/BaiF CoA-transferase family protein [Pseudonocardia endophytica]